MKQKSVKTDSREKLMGKVLEIFRERSTKPLDLARKEILEMNIESQKAREALKYYTKNWDDITHPGILSIACEAVGGNPVDAIPIQVVMLLLAAAIDIHDDIIDQSKIKNGKPTIFGKFGKDMALLVGDALLMKSFTLLYKCEEKFPQKTVSALFDTIENTLFEMGNAHLLEINFKGRLDVIPDEYLKVIEKKAANVEAQTRIGAIIGRSTKNEIEALGKYGRILGILITLREEFIDVFEPEELHNRMKNECLPLPILYAFQNPRVKKKILKKLAKGKISENTADEIVEIVLSSKEVQKLRGIMEKISEEALDFVYQSPELYIKPMLTLLLRATLEDLQ
ncbi:polyprenyl synthetase family protein [Candidatus Bathyarchaeota archaeon]|nr:polyprenyl synthetase family protein [Candidatus Bathyarchaeota archaeon]